jgi:acetyltransferase-like isoleucine patch superfamily enzyme
MDELARWKEDRARYPPSAWWTEPALWAHAIYRLGRWAEAATSPKAKIARRAHRRLHLLARPSSRSRSRRASTSDQDCGSSTRGPIVITATARIGARCRMRQGVTIGVLERGGPAPVIGDDVMIGPYAQILGGVHVATGRRSAR